MKRKKKNRREKGKERKKKDFQLEWNEIFINTKHTCSD